MQSWEGQPSPLMFTLIEGMTLEFSYTLLTQLGLQLQALETVRGCLSPSLRGSLGCQGSSRPPSCCPILPRDPGQVRGPYQAGG